MNELEHLRNVVNAWDHWIDMKLKGASCRIVNKSRSELHQAIDKAREHVEARRKLEEIFDKISADICKVLHIDPNEVRAVPVAVMAAGLAEQQPAAEKAPRSKRKA